MITHQPPSTYILRYFEDIDVLPSIAWTPQTIGWQVLGGALLTILFFYAFKHTQSWYRNRYRSEAIQVIQSMDCNDELYARELFRIMKVVLAHLSSNNHTVFGAPFFLSLAKYYPVRLEPSLEQAWTLSLVSQNAPLTEHQKFTLKIYCVTWLNQHERNPA